MENYKAVAADLKRNRKEWRIDDDKLTRIIKTKEHEVRVVIYNALTDKTRIVVTYEDKTNYGGSFNHTIRPGFFARRDLRVAMTRWRGSFVDDLIGLLSTKPEA